MTTTTTTQADKGGFTYGGNEYCHTVQRIYPWRSSPTLQCAHASTDDYPGINDKQTVLDIALKATVLSKGYLPECKCGCCPSWDRSSWIGGYHVYHLYALSEDIVSQMSALENPSVFKFSGNLPSWYGGTSMATALSGTGTLIEPLACADSTTPPTAVCRTANLRIQYVHHIMCMESSMPLEIRGVYVTHELRCGCCISHAANDMMERAGYRWHSQPSSTQCHTQLAR